MKVAFDTSVLVAAIVTSHTNHAPAFAWVNAAVRREIDGMMSWHAVAETWAVLTRLPMAPAVSADGARLAVDRVRSSIPASALSGADYLAAMERCAERRVRSGAIFDALHLVCAEVAGAEVLVTFNEDDFRRLASDAGPQIVVPSMTVAVPG